MDAVPSRDAIVAQVKGVVGQVLKLAAADIDEQADLEALGADSLDRMTLVVSLEDYLKAPISDDEARALKTVADVVACIERRLASG